MDKAFFWEIRFKVSLPMKMSCDNHNASKPSISKKIMHIKVDCHIVSEKVDDGLILTPHVTTQDQLADIFTKVAFGTLFRNKKSFVIKAFSKCHFYKGI